VEASAGGSVVSQPKQPRLPIQPLLDVLARRGVSPWSQEAVAYNGGAWGKAMRDGVVPIFTADKLAVRLGLHPAQVWGQAFYDDEPMAVASPAQDGP
jgi:hypothetical protein